MSRNIFYSPSYISGSMSEREMLSFMAIDTKSEPHHPAYSPITLSPAPRSKPTNLTPHLPTADPEWPDSVAQASVIYLNPYICITISCSQTFLQAQLILPHEPAAAQSQTTIERTAAQLIPPHEPATTQSQTVIHMEKWPIHRRSSCFYF